MVRIPCNAIQCFPDREENTSESVVRKAENALFSLLLTELFIKSLYCRG